MYEDYRYARRICSALYYLLALVPDTVCDERSYLIHVPTGSGGGSGELLHPDLLMSVVSRLLMSLLLYASS